MGADIEQIEGTGSYRLTALASGDTEGLRYKFVWEQNGWANWGVIRDDDADPSAVWVPPAEGSYTIWVDFVDSTGKRTSLTYDVVVASPWDFGIDVGPSAVSSGEAVSVASSIEGATGEGFTFNYLWNYEGAWQEWDSTVKSTGQPTSATSWSFTPQKPGRYQVHVDVMDPTGFVRTYDTWVWCLGDASASDRVEIDTPYIDQNAYGAWMGCEAASLYMALKGCGHLEGVTYPQFLAAMPRTYDGNPYHGFVGDPYSVTSGLYQSIYPAPLAQWGAAYGSVRDVSGSTVEDLVRYVQMGQPVVVYVTVDFEAVEWKTYHFGPAVDNAHVMTLVGYDPAKRELLVADPNSRGRYWVGWDAFAAAYDAQRFAVAVA